MAQGRRSPGCHWLAWVNSALHSGSLIYKDLVLPSEKWACLVSMARLPAQQRELVGHWACDFCDTDGWVPLVSQCG